MDFAGCHGIECLAACAQHAIGADLARDDVDVTVVDAGQPGFLAVRVGQCEANPAGRLREERLVPARRKTRQEVSQCVAHLSPGERTSRSPEQGHPKGMIRGPNVRCTMAGWSSSS